MAETWHGYFAIEDINMNATQRQALWDELQTRMSTSIEFGQPSEFPQYRFNNDRTKIIIEAKFRQSALTIDKFKQRLGAIFGVNPDTIDHATNQVVLDVLPTPIVTFSRLGTNYIRFVAFGGIESTWLESQIEVTEYLKQNSSEWEEI